MGGRVRVSPILTLTLTLSLALALTLTLTLTLTLALALSPTLALNPNQVSNAWIIGVVTAFASSGVRITRVFAAAGDR